jgi:hypothetical protein
MNEQNNLNLLPFTFPLPLNLDSTAMAKLNKIKAEEEQKKKDEIMKMEIEGKNNVKIIDKYKLNNTNYDYGDKIGLRQINEPLCLDSNCLRINCKDDILEKIFIIYELYDDFEISNINFLLDILSTSEISLYADNNIDDNIDNINIVKLFQINLIMSYFFCSYTDDDIIYINQEELNNQISIGEFNPKEHKYCDMIGYLLEKNKYSNKLLIIPIFTELFINLIPLRFINGIKISYEKINSSASTFIKNKHLSLQTINLQYLSRQHYFEKKEFFVFSVPIMSNKIYCDYIDIGKDISSYQYQCNYDKHFDYLIIKLTPNYELIDHELWSESVDMLPTINFINYGVGNYDYSGDDWVNFQPNDIALFRKNKNFHVYTFPGNPYLSLKSQINGLNKNKGNLIEIINKVYESINIGGGSCYMADNYYYHKNVTETDNGSYSKDWNKYSSDKCIKFNIDTPIIPIIINVEVYRSNILDIHCTYGSYKVKLANNY